MMECHVCILFVLLTHVLGKNKSSSVSSPSVRDAVSNVTDGKALKDNPPSSVQNNLQGMF